MSGIDKLTRKYIENSAIETVIQRLLENGWNYSLNMNSRKGYDIEVSKDNRVRKLEVKGRSIYDLSGYQFDSAVQKEKPRRYFSFSNEQVIVSDFFICVFIGPKMQKCIVIPKTDFQRLEKTSQSDVKKDRRKLAFDYRYNHIPMNGETVDISEYIEGWYLLNK